MNCHSQIWNASPLLAPVREAYFANRPFYWQKVNRLPHWVYFNHAIHVNKGVGCVTCHGRVDLMPAVFQAQSLTMNWCLGCHRNPAPNLRPLDQITSLTYVPRNPALQQELVRRYDVKPRTACDTCHR